MIRGGHTNQHRDKLLKAKKYIKLPMKDIQCCWCGKIFKGKYQKNNSKCDECLKNTKRIYNQAKRQKANIAQNW